MPISGLPAPQGSQSGLFDQGAASEIMRHFADCPQPLLWLCARTAAACARPAPRSRRAPDYAKDSTWLCLPGRADTCSTPLATTALNPNGYGSSGPSAVAKDPPIDCFYVYPTVSSDQGMNSDLNAGREEKLAAEVQFARFASVCRTVRADLPADDRRRGRRLCGRRRHQPAVRARLSRRRRRVAQLPRDAGTRAGRSCSSATARAA